jgi:hypothetical protein
MTQAELEAALAADPELFPQGDSVVQAVELAIGEPLQAPTNP